MSKLKASMSRIQAAQSLRSICMSMPTSLNAVLQSARNFSELLSRVRKRKRRGLPSFSRRPVAGLGA
jgi:hypothetical protein